jgi:hypothetical protein
MSKNIAPSLHTLPIELIYRLLDCLELTEIFLSLSNVCIQLDAVLSSYPRYQVKLNPGISLNFNPLWVMIKSNKEADVVIV